MGAPGCGGRGVSGCGCLKVQNAGRGMHVSMHACITPALNVRWAQLPDFLYHCAHIG